MLSEVDTLDRWNHEKVQSSPGAEPDQRLIIIEHFEKFFFFLVFVLGLTDLLYQLHLSGSCEVASDDTCWCPAVGAHSVSAYVV